MTIDYQTESWKNRKINLLGHALLVHVFDWEAPPLHEFPPCCGEGLLQLLDRVCVPEAQVTEHDPQDPQPPQLPCTETVKLLLNIL